MIRTLFAISMCFITIYTMNAQEYTKINISVGNNSYVATIYDNAAARAFVSLLPLTITMNELNGNEKYYHLPADLPGSPERPAGIKVGDLMLYSQNSLVLFYEAFTTSYSYTKIGYIHNPAGLEAALGPNNPTVTFKLYK